MPLLNPCLAMVVSLSHCSWQEDLHLRSGKRHVFGIYVHSDNEVALKKKKKSPKKAVQLTTVPVVGFPVLISTDILWGSSYRNVVQVTKDLFLTRRKQATSQGTGRYYSLILQEPAYLCLPAHLLSPSQRQEPNIRKKQVCSLELQPLGPQHERAITFPSSKSNVFHAEIKLQSTLIFWIKYSVSSPGKLKRRIIPT